MCLPLFANLTQQCAELYLQDGRISGLMLRDPLGTKQKCKHVGLHTITVEELV